MNKVFICLANSRKTSGRCIAGKEFSPSSNTVGNWIRPISAREHHEISEFDRRYENGETAQVLDVINVPFKSKTYHPAQEENYLIDDVYYWEKHSRYSGSLDALLDHPRSLWENSDSSYNGVNDRVHVTSITQPMQSLYFIAPTQVAIVVQIEGADFSNPKKKVRADFVYNNQRYFISITDPIIESRYLAQGVGRYQLTGKVYMTISLGEAWEGYYYKLAACIFEV